MDHFVANRGDVVVAPLVAEVEVATVVVLVVAGEREIALVGCAYETKVVPANKRREGEK